MRGKETGMDAEMLKATGAKVREAVKAKAESKSDDIADGFLSKY